ncbi:hypothetical protein HMPREF1361_01228 [Enterococcus faecium ERV1]|nr:hypothetical protein HMPREF1361_01228 [Enterococcus faecium ERV1]
MTKVVSQLPFFFRINGVQKLASAVKAHPNEKYEELFLLGCFYYLIQDSFFTTSYFV